MWPFEHWLRTSLQCAILSALSVPFSFDVHLSVSVFCFVGCFMFADWKTDNPLMGNGLIQWISHSLILQNCVSINRSYLAVSVSPSIHLLNNTNLFLGMPSCRASILHLPIFSSFLIFIRELSYFFVPFHLWTDSIFAAFKQRKLIIITNSNSHCQTLFIFFHSLSLLSFSLICWLDFQTEVKKFLIVRRQKIEEKEREEENWLSTLILWAVKQKLQ